MNHKLDDNVVSEVDSAIREVGREKVIETLRALNGNNDMSSLTLTIVANIENASPFV